ncbi:MAG TPA: sulfotransferase [Pseudolabrys sp.]|nr:sulfotransferase [Pseudolabrys sp.]
MTPIEQAIAAHKSGKLDEAETLYRAVLARNPREFDALHLFGILCAQRERFEEAERLLSAALAVDRKLPPCLHNYGNVLSKLGRYSDAIAVYNEALALAPNYAPLYSDRGNAQNELGQTEAAVTSYRKALSLNPNSPPILGNLAQALMALDRIGEAGQLLQRALSLDAKNPQVLKLLGQLAFRRGELDAALDLLGRSLAVKPDQADAHNLTGMVLRDKGRIDDAIAAFDRSIALAPKDGSLYFGLAETKTFKPGDPHLAAMQSLADSPGTLSPRQRVNLEFALGKAYADIKDHGRSFRHLLAANAGKRATLAYDETAEFAFFADIEAVFSPALLAAKSGGGDPSRLPIFVLGMPRSGTTLVEQILASHPAVHGAGELETLNQIVQARAEVQSLPFPAFVAALTPADLNAIGTQYTGALSGLAPAAERITDKTPRNFFFIGLIHLALPNAVIIHTVRDPIDTCLSCFSKQFMTGQLFTYDLGELGRYYRRYRSLMAHWRRVLPPDRILDVRYEDVVADLEGQARRILEHCGLPWDERCLAFHRNERPVRTASAAQVRQPIYGGAVGRWRDYKDFIAPLLNELRVSEFDAGTSGSENSR